MFHNNFDSIGIETLQEVGFPVVVQSRRKAVREQALNLGIGHGTDHVDERCAKLPQRFEHPFALLNRAVVTDHNARHPITLGRGHENGRGAEFVWRCSGELVIKPQ